MIGHLSPPARSISRSRACCHLEWVGRAGAFLICSSATAVRQSGSPVVKVSFEARQPGRGTPDPNTV